MPTPLPLIRRLRRLRSMGHRSAPRPPAAMRDHGSTISWAVVFILKIASLFTHI